MGRCFLFSFDILELLNPVNMSVILSQLVPFFVGIISLNIGVVIQIIIQRHKCSCLIELTHSVSAVNKIRIFASGDQGANCLGSRLAGKPCLIHFHPGLFCDDLLNFIVVINLRSGNGEESCKFFSPILILAASSSASGKQRNRECRYQQHSRYSFCFHNLPP